MRACFFGVVVAASIGVLTVQPADADDRLRQFSISQVERILKAEGYSSVDRQSDTLILLRVDGSRYGIFVDDDGDIQGYYGLNADDVSLRTVNRWNRTKRFSRAYIDSEGDPVLEADLDATEGVTRDQVAWFVKLFISSAQTFHDHLAESQ